MVRGYTGISDRKTGVAIKRSYGNPKNFIPKEFYRKGKSVPHFVIGNKVQKIDMGHVAFSLKIIINILSIIHYVYS